MTLSLCPHFGLGFGSTIDVEGKPVTLHHCAIHRLCTVEPFIPMAGTSPIRSCRGCPDLPAQVGEPAESLLIVEPDPLADAPPVARVMYSAPDDVPPILIRQSWYEWPERGPPPAYATDRQATMKHGICLKSEFDVSIIVPMFKSASHIAKQIARWPNYAEGLSVELVYVDDACPHNSQIHVVRAWEKRSTPIGVGIAVMRRDTNGGFAAACNTGARVARGKILIFLNADTILHPGSLRPLTRHLRHDPKVGVTGPMILREDGKIDSLGSRWGWGAGAFEHIGGWEPGGEEQPALREMVTGACIAVRSKTFWEVGGFDERYKVGYHEDADLCMRIREAGYDIWFEPGAHVTHAGQHSGAAGHPQAKANKERFYDRWVRPQIIDRFVAQRRHRPTLNRVLFRRHGAMGDVLVASSTIAPFLELHPGCKVDFETVCQSVLDGHPLIERVIHPDLARLTKDETEYDAVIDLDSAYERQPYSNALECYARIAGVAVEACRFYVPQAECTIPLSYVVIHAGPSGGNWVGRNWSIQKFYRLAAELKSSGREVVFLAADSRTSAAEMAGIISKADLFIGLDSFPFHIAQALNIPCVTIFGSVRPEAHTYRSNVTPVSVPGLSCLGCHHDSPAPAGDTRVCRVGGEPCLNDLTVEMVFEKAMEVLGK